MRDVLSHDYLSPKQEQALLKLLIKYKKQLSNMGIDYNNITLSNNYNHNVPEEAKEIKITFGKYRGKSLYEVAKEDFSYVRWLSENALNTYIRRCADAIINNKSLPQPEKPKTVIRLENGKILIKAPYDKREVCRSLSNRKWNPDLRVWEAPLDILDEVIQKFPEAELSQLLKEEVEKRKQLKEMSSKVSNGKTIKFSDSLELLPFQSVGVEFIDKAGGKALIADEMGCIDGDALISLNRNGKSFKMKLSKLYERFNNINTDRYSWDLSRPTYARSLMPDGTIRLNRILNVIDKGIKNVIKITTESGKELKLTPDHEILTSNGWKESKNLKVGEKILTNGIQVCKLCGTNKNIITYKYAKFKGYCKSCMYKQLRNNYLKYSRIKRHDGFYIAGGLEYHPHNSTGGIAEHRLVMEAHINGLSLDEWLEKLRTNNFKNYKILSKDVDIHHIDGNVYNNDINNLKIVSRSEHHRIHNKYKNIHNIFIPKEEKVVKIENAGKSHVYDIVMEDPARNFIANGIIVHNCGKTVQALAWLRLHPENRPAIIVCPASLKLNWEREAKKWLTENEKIHVVNGKGWKNNQTIYIINYDILKKHYEHLTSIDAKVIILDESHYVKNSKAQRTKLATEISRKIPNRILLTGTPVLNRPVELWQQLNILDPNTWNNFFSYGVRYCNGQRTMWGWDFSGASNIEELNEKLKTIMVRRTKAQVLKELPDKRYSSVVVPISNRQEYTQAESQFLSYIRKIKGDEAVMKAKRAEMLTKIEALKQLSARGKMKAIFDWIDNFIESGEKLVIFANHTEIINNLYEKYKDIAVKLTGADSQEARQKAVDDFQNKSEIKIFIGNIKASGVGITLTASSNVAFIELPWTPSELQQATDRLHRIGQKSAVNVYYLLGENTIDEKIAKLLEEKASIVDAVIDGKEQKNLNILDDLIKEVR